MAMQTNEQQISATQAETIFVVRITDARIPEDDESWDDRAVM